MKDERLADLNFREIVHYGGQPPVCHSYSSRLDCKGYCVSCEETGLLTRAGVRLDLMSHGCDSDDFEAVLGPMPGDGVGVSRPVLFLLDMPGRDSGNGCVVEFRGFRKRPPVYHYYWTPGGETWPTDIDEFDGNFYGPYFAYLMRRHQLRNVYITNVVKCRWVKEKGDGRGSRGPVQVERHCAERYLVREVRLFAPELVLCFGRRAEKGFRQFVMGRDSRCRVVRLMHPAYIRSRWQTRWPSQRCAVLENDRRVEEAIRQIA